MIYDMDDPKALGEVPGDPSPEPDWSIWKKMGCFFVVLFYFPKIAYFMGRRIFEVFSNVEEFEKKVNEEKVNDQALGLFNFGRMGMGVKKDDAKRQYIYTMNYDALKGFTYLIKKQLWPDAGRQLMVTGKKNLKAGDVGFHVHAEDFLSVFPGPLTVGISDGLMSVEAGSELYASWENWEKVLGAWADVAVKRVPKRIVLDAAQAGWCDPKSTGRFVIEYIPDYVAPKV